MQKILLNADLGESFGTWSKGNDSLAMPLIDMANIACGMHAADPLTMQESIKLAKQHQVLIGAHPGYDDLLGFGRRSIPSSSEQIYALVLFQLGALAAFCQAQNVKLDYVKPHGALYNDMMNNLEIFTTIVQAIYDFDPKLKIMVLSGKNTEAVQNICKQYQMKIYYEVFLDRNYTDSADLVARSQDNALLNKDQILNRIKLLLSDGIIKSEK